jgi:hypothetical protein
LGTPPFKPGIASPYNLEALTNSITIPTNSDVQDAPDPAIDKQLDNFLLELGQITVDQKNNVEMTKGEAKGEVQGGGNKQGTWQAILDNDSSEYYYWNTVTDEVPPFLL